MPSIRNNEFRAAQAMMILKIIIIFDLLMIAFDFMELQLIIRITRGEAVGPHAEKHNEIRQLLLSIFYTVVSFCSGLAFWGWLNRSYSNINRLGMEKTRYRPAWTLLSFIIPVVNLYMPYIIVKETMEKNRIGLSRIKNQTPELQKGNRLPWWWTFWLLSILSSVIYLLLLKLPMTRDHRITLASLSIISDALDIPAALLAISVIRKIYSIEAEIFKKSFPGNAS